MSINYLEFAAWLLSDVATPRYNEPRLPGEPKHIVFVGDHICRTFVIPMRDDGESAKDFKRRLGGFHKRLDKLMRGSDRARRRAQACEALERHCNGWRSGAAMDVIMLANANANPQVLGINDRRGTRKTLKRQDASEDERRISSIRACAARYRKEHPDFDSIFERTVQNYRSLMRRRDWRDEQIKKWEAWALAFFAMPWWPTWFETMPLVELARLHHENGNFARAADLYRRAAHVATRADMPSEAMQEPIVGSLEMMADNAEHEGLVLTLERRVS